MDLSANCSRLYQQLLEHTENITFSASLFLECTIGPPRRQSAVFLTCLYSILLATGLAGNIAALLSIMTNKRMQTPTDWYITSLAASDILILFLGIPEDIYLVWSQYPWPFGLWFCRLRNMASETFTYISILTIMAFTAERYLAIVHPLLSRQLLTSRKTRVYKVIFIIWIVAIINGLPYAFFSTINYAQHPVTRDIIPESAHCTLPLQNSASTQFLEYAVVVFFIFPLLLLVFLYTKIGIAISRRSLTQPRPVEPNSDQTMSTSTSTASRPLRSMASSSIDEGTRQRSRHKVSVTKMHISIVLSFFICFSFFHASRLMTMYTDWEHASDALKASYTKLHMISGVLYYLNPSLNPVLYALHTRKFQKGLYLFLQLCGYKPAENGSRSIISTSRLPSGKRQSKSAQVTDSSAEKPATHPSSPV